jgi:hypothetical protein
VLINEGILGFYKGLGSGIIGTVVSFFIYFFWYRFFKNFFKQIASSKIFYEIFGLLKSAFKDRTDDEIANLSRALVETDKADDVAVAIKNFSSPINQVASGLNEYDTGLMIKFIDDTRINKSVDKNLELEARMLAEAKGINANQSNSSLANKFSEILDTARKTNKTVDDVVLGRLSTQAKNELSEEIDRALDEAYGKPVDRKPAMVITEKEHRAVAEELIRSVNKELERSANKKGAVKAIKDKVVASVDIVGANPPLEDTMKDWLKKSTRGKAEAEKEAAIFKIPESADNLFKHEAGTDYTGRNLVASKFDELLDRANKAGNISKSCRCRYLL